MHAHWKADGGTGLDEVAMKYKDYYQIMGLTRDASTEDIKKAYRKLAHQYHPDISKDPKSTQRFQEIGEAYAVLKDPEKRAAYDQLGQQPQGEQFSPPPEWQQQFHAGASGFEDVDLADLFSAFTRGAGAAGRRGAMRGRDVELVAPVTLEQVYAGAQIEVRAELPELDDSGLAHRKQHSFRLTVPQGATDGQRMRLAGKGGRGAHGGPPGDLYVVLELQPHPLFRVSGHDLYMDLPLAPWEAVLGAAVRVPTLGGLVELNVKPGSTAGQQLRLGGRGLRSSGGRTGDLYAVITIVVPQSASADEKAAYQQLARVSHFSPRRHFSPPSQA
jgi:curved DNA-binding protein